MSISPKLVTPEYIEEQAKYRERTPGRKLLEEGRDNVVIFSLRMLGVKLYAWQIEMAIAMQKAILERKDAWNKFYPILSKCEENGWEYEYVETPEKDIYFNYTDDSGVLKSHLIEIKGSEFLALTSRQIGKSTLLAVMSIWACVYNHIPATIGNNTLIGIASAGDVQAKKLLNEMKKIIRIGDVRMSKYLIDNKAVFGKNFFSNLLDDKEENNKTTITFKSHSDNFGILLEGSYIGSCIKSYPPTSIVLGETFSFVIEDEAGKSDKITDEFHKDYMYPTGNSTFAIRAYTSTPWTHSGFFYELVDPDDNYAPRPALTKFCFDISAIQIENPLYYKQVLKEIESLNSNGDTDTVQRAYYCRFVKGQTAYFDPEKVFNMFNEGIGMVDSFSAPCDMGIDFGGQTKSRTVITISHLNDNNEIIRLYHKVYEVRQDNNIIEDVAELRRRFNIQRIIPEYTPQSDYLIRKMEEMGWELEPMQPRTDKVKKYGAFRSALNKGKIHSYVDTDLRTEMLALEFSKGSKQSLIQHAPGYNDDIIDSFMMSCFFFVQEEDSVTFYEW